MRSFPTPIILETLLAGLFDYAGMFPPAALALDDALRESAGLPASLRRPWLLGADLVVTVETARTLLSMDLRPFGFMRPLRLALLATEKPESVDDVISSFLSSEKQEGVPHAVSSIELKVPSEDASSLVEPFDRLTVRHNIPFFLEPDLSQANWAATLTETTTLLSRCTSAAGLKCRLTGPTGIDADRLAGAVVAVCDAKLPFKVTGGLHHPFFNPKRADSKGGFINVAAAVMLRRALGDQISKESIIGLLENEDAKALSFDESLNYGALVVESNQLSVIKSSAPFSIGSCSLREPDDDLHKLLD